MDRTAQIKDGEEASNRTVVLLFALAGLALRAAGASVAIRWLVLWALRRGERIAMAYVAECAVGSSGRAWPTSFVPGRPGNDPGAAIDLARSLRALALAVRAMEMRAGHRPRTQAAAGRSQATALRGHWDRAQHSATLAVAMLRPVPPCDTS